MARPLLLVPAGPPHLWRALRYTELNPVRARMVSTPQSYRWSSAGSHCGTAQPDLVLDTDLWQQHWNPTTWKQYLSEPGAEAHAEQIRLCTHTGRPLGTADVLRRWRNLPVAFSRHKKEGVVRRRQRTISSYLALTRKRLVWKL
jgi:hypothetical protein